MSVSRRRFGRRAAVVTSAALCLAAAAIYAVGLFGQVARAAQVNSPSGSFTFAGKLLTGCPLGSVLCTSGTFTGSIQGPFEFTILTLVPSPTVGVSYFDGKLTAHLAGGDLKCDLNGALNLRSNSQGEFGEICVITSGTGAYAKATGHLRLIGVSTTSNVVVPAGGGDYAGTIITPTT